MRSQKRLPSYVSFKKEGYTFKPSINYRTHPECYRVGKGEQGVLICEPYKSEILPHWRFKTPDIAKKSAATIYKLFLHYLRVKDFIGADMARKYLQMGFSRARRYANYVGGIKYDKKNGYALNKKGKGDPKKAISAKIFYEMWQKAENNQRYAALKQAWKNQFG